MNVELAEDLKEIDYHLRVNIDIGSIETSVHTLLCLINNYPKVDGFSFKSHMEEHHPEQLLRHVESTNGNRQDILTVCAGPMCFHARFYIEYLDLGLAVHGKNNILEENVSILLGSTNVIALIRAHAIFNKAITIPMRWLIANYQKLDPHNWSVRCIRRTTYRIYEQALFLRETPSLFTNQDFIMGIMKHFREELPPYASFHRHHYGTKTKFRVVTNANKVLLNKEISQEMFHPSDPSNLETYFLMEELGEILADSLTSELTDTR